MTKKLIIGLVCDKSKTRHTDIKDTADEISEEISSALGIASSTGVQIEVTDLEGVNVNAYDAIVIMLPRLDFKASFRADDRSWYTYQKAAQGVVLTFLAYRTSCGDVRLYTTTTNHANPYSGGRTTIAGISGSTAEFGRSMKKLADGRMLEHYANIHKSHNPYMEVELPKQSTEEAWAEKRMGESAKKGFDLNKILSDIDYDRRLLLMM